jgi:chaperonin GroES
MKAIGRNIIIQVEKKGVTKTTNGLLLTEKQTQDIRYNKATVIAVSDEVAETGLDVGNCIYFDRHAGHKIELEDKTYHVIKLQDVVVVL